MDREKVMEVLNQVYDPDYVDQSIVDMGLVGKEDITIKGNRVEVAYSLTAPMCPFSAAIGLMIKYAVEKKLGVSVTVKLKAGHHQENVVTELLQNPERSKELLQRLKEFGILESCVRLQEEV